MPKLYNVCRLEKTVAVGWTLNTNNYLTNCKCN